MSGMLSPDVAALDPVAAQAVLEAQFVARIGRMARDPSADPGAIRDAFDKLEPLDALRLSDQADAALRRTAERRGDWTVYERVAPFLPGSNPEQRAALERDAAEAVRPILSDSGKLIHAALGTVLDHRLPDAPAAVREDLAAHAERRIGEREATAGPAVLDLDGFDRLVARVREVSITPAAPPAPEPPRLATVRTLDEVQGIVDEATGRAPHDPMDGLRESIMRRIATAEAEGPAAVKALLTDAEIQRDRKILAAYPEQAAKLDEAIREAQQAPRRQAPEAIQAGEPAPSIEITRRGRNEPPEPDAGLPGDPEAIQRAYIGKDGAGERLYYKRSDGELAIRATERVIQGMLRDGETIGAMLDLAAARGWSDVQIRGDRDIARDTWIEATARGLNAEGYQPSREDRHQAEQRRVERAQNELPPLEAYEPLRQRPPRLHR